MRDSPSTLSGAWLSIANLPPDAVAADRNRDTRVAAHAVPREQLFGRIVSHTGRITAFEKRLELAAAQGARLLACRPCLVTIATNARRGNPARRGILPGPP